MSFSSRPLIWGLAAFCALVGVAVSSTGAFASRGRASVAEVPRLASAIENELDELRLSDHLPRLAVSPGLTAAARLHSREMLVSGRFQHASPDGTPFWKRIERFYGSIGYRRWDVAENLVWSPGQLSAQAVVRSWLASAPHRRIMLDPTYREFGIAVVSDSSTPTAERDGGATVVTADFGLRVR